MSEIKEEDLKNEFLKSTERKERKDFMFFSSSKSPEYNMYFIKCFNYSNYLFTRAVAKDFLFDSIDFSKTIFDNCYLKDCRFINCKFTGAKFINTNLSNSYFRDCNFDYATFEKTFVDEEILECLPEKENLKYKFARSLRLNYASIGNNEAVKKVIAIEIQSTKKHLLDSWTSGDEWHTKKYGGLKKRTIQFTKWAKYYTLDFIWGNGESLFKLIRFNFFLISGIAIIDIFNKKEGNNINYFIENLFFNIPAKYFGLKLDGLENYSTPLELLLVIFRLVSMSLFVSLIVKKYSRR